MPLSKEVSLKCSGSQTLLGPFMTQWGERFQSDLLEPEYYPDPAFIRTSLQAVSRDEEELMKNLKDKKGTIFVLAPYLKIMRKQIMKTAVKMPKAQKNEKVMFRKKQTEESVSGLAPNIEGKSEMIVSILETAQVLKSLLHAKNVVAYIVNPESNEITQIPYNSESSHQSLTWKIESSTTMAAYTASKKEYVVSMNVNLDDRFPLGLGFPDSMTKYAMSIPVKTPDKKVVAVYELSRNSFDVPFTPHDVQIVLTIAGWMGVSILQNAQYTKSARHQELTEYLMQLTKHYHSETVDVSKTISDIVVFARETMKAEKVTAFVSESPKKNDVIVAYEYDQGVDDSRVMYKRRSKKTIVNDGSILGQVMFSRNIVNKTYTTTDFSKDTVRSVLCVPAMYKSDVLGALYLSNKKKAHSFNRDDEEYAVLFAEFLAINIYHMKLHDKLKKNELHSQVLREMLYHHTKPCVHDREELKNYSSDLPEGFFTLSWYPSPDQIPKLAEMTINMFHEVLGDSLFILNNVSKFILTVKNCYRPNPYHNFVHAFCVAHTMGNIILRYRKVFTGIERKGLLIAALCHDLDHRGYNNNFLQLTQHYLANLYDSSPLENHHFAVTKMLIHECGMFRYLSSAIYNELLAEIYDDIIATDLSLYFQNKNELISVADSKTFTFKNPKHRRLVKSLMMTACDLSGQTKPLRISSKITEDVYEEFFTQGDIEKKMGLIPLPTMDREKEHMLAENQVQFMSLVVLPCVETMSKIFTELSPMVWDTKKLLHDWKEIVANKKAHNWTPSGSF